MSKHLCKRIESKKTTHWFHSVYTSFHSQWWVALSPHSWQCLLSPGFWSGHSNGLRWNLKVVFICISPIAKDAEKFRKYFSMNLYSGQHMEYHEVLCRWKGKVGSGGFISATFSVSQWLFKNEKWLISIEINVFILLSRVAKKLSPMIPSRNLVLGLTLHSVIHLNQACEV